MAGHFSLSRTKKYKCELRWPDMMTPGKKTQTNRKYIFPQNDGSIDESQLFIYLFHFFFIFRKRYFDWSARVVCLFFFHRPHVLQRKVLRNVFFLPSSTSSVNIYSIFAIHQIPSIIRFNKIDQNYLVLTHLLSCITFISLYSAQPGPLSISHARVRHEIRQ